MRPGVESEDPRLYPRLFRPAHAIFALRTCFFRNLEPMSPPTTVPATNIAIMSRIQGKLCVLGHHRGDVRGVVIGPELLHVGLAEEQVGHDAVEAERHPVDDVAADDALDVVIGALAPHGQLSDDGADDGDRGAVEPSHERIESAEHQDRRSQHSSLADAVGHHDVERRRDQGEQPRPHEKRVLGSEQHVLDHFRCHREKHDDEVEHDECQDVARGPSAACQSRSSASIENPP